MTADPASDSRRIDAAAFARDRAAVADALGVATKDVALIDDFLEENTNLQERLMADFPDAFGGIYVTYAPARVTILWAAPLSAAPKDLFERDLVVLREVAHSEKDLMHFQALVNDNLDAQGIESDNWLDIQSGTLHIEVTSENRARLDGLIGGSFADLDPAPSIVVRTVGELSDPAAVIRGGRPTTSCTSGFNVTNGRRHGTTAGHCGNTQSFDGTSSTFVNQAYSGSRDIQWHSFSTGHTLPAEFYMGDVRPVVSSRSWGALVVGEPVCKYGKTTGVCCGTITSKTHKPTYVPSAEPTFIRVNRGSPYDFIDHGDSGGPWYYGTKAFGWTSGMGGGKSYAIFQSVSFIPSGFSLLYS